jgi:hypothetical protein
VEAPVTAWAQGDQAIIWVTVVAQRDNQPVIIKTDALPGAGLLAVPEDQLHRPVPPPAASHVRQSLLLDQVNNLARELAGAEHGREAGLAEIGRQFLTILEGP